MDVDGAKDEGDTINAGLAEGDHGTIFVTE